MKEWDVVILGAGAAGLMCGIEAGKRKRRVLILDHANKPGKKILLSGGGRCNFTNLHASPQAYLSQNPHFCKSALSRYTPLDFLAWVKSHGIPYHEKELGQLFCDNSASDLLNALLKDIQKWNVKIQMHTQILSIESLEKGFVLKTNQGVYHSRSLVIASGGLSFPTMGASPLGYQIAAQFGLKVQKTRAALVPLSLDIAEKMRFSPLSGLSIDGRASVDKRVFEGPILLTHRGLSGPAILQISSYWEPQKNLHLDFCSKVKIVDFLKSEKTAKNQSQIKNVLVKYLPKRLIDVLLETRELEIKCIDLSFRQIEEIAKKIHNITIKPSGTEGYRTAEVTLGGVDCDDICSKTFQAKKVAGLYFIGEVLDVTGFLGGYNFQWAWASGVAAGCCV